MQHRRRTPACAATRRLRGFTLIEVLVTVLVLSIGLLGLAGLQLRGLQSNQSAYMRSQATILAYDIIDRMRANRATALAGSYTVAYGTAPTGETGCQATSANCSEAALAAFDLNQWKCSLGKWNGSNVCTTLGMTGALPDGDGRVALAGGVVTVTIKWNDKDGGETSLPVSTEL